jgi:nitrogen regulatory protein P-II 2
MSCSTRIRTLLSSAYTLHRATFSRTKLDLDRTVKLIIAIIQPTKLEEVKEALTEVEVFRLTVLDCLGFGRQRGQKSAFRGQDMSINLVRKVQLQIAVNDEFVEPTINAILAGAREGEKGQIGDGKIFVVPMDDCIRIRTGERGPDAI